jgi:hypothetical protein
MISLSGLKLLQVNESSFSPLSIMYNYNFILGGEAGVIWQGPSWYGNMFENILKKDLGSDSEVNKIKVSFFFHIFYFIEFLL